MQVLLCNSHIVTYKHGQVKRGHVKPHCDTVVVHLPMLCDLQVWTGEKRGHVKSHCDTVAGYLHTHCDLQAGTSEKRGRVESHCDIVAGYLHTLCDLQAWTGEKRGRVKSVGADLVAGCCRPGGLCGRSDLWVCQRHCEGQ